ncbi:serine/arginine-rich splicing factor RS31 [Tanacetum coccineum]|uniref:Serine/arginine-rich splicing factor RS31 n=1 Tax=Tanacetum coccineum TaxID=301880 RepID=A0ABQ5A395_9ASTR
MLLELPAGTLSAGMLLKLNLITSNGRTSVSTTSGRENVGPLTTQFSQTMSGPSSEIPRTKVNEVQRQRVGMKQTALSLFETQEEATKANECTYMSITIVGHSVYNKVLDRVVSVEYALRDEGERGDRSKSLRRDYGRRGDSPIRRSICPYSRDRPSPDYGRAHSLIALKQNVVPFSSPIHAPKKDQPRKQEQQVSDVPPTASAIEAASSNVDAVENGIHEEEACKEDQVSRCPAITTQKNTKDPRSYNGFQSRSSRALISHLLAISYINSLTTATTKSSFTTGCLISGLVIGPLLLEIPVATNEVRSVFVFVVERVPISSDTKILGQSNGNKKKDIVMEKHHGDESQGLLQLSWHLHVLCTNT